MIDMLRRKRTVKEALKPYHVDTTTVETCRICGGDLIRSEVRYGTCGHCGRRNVATKREKETPYVSTR